MPKFATETDKSPKNVNAGRLARPNSEHQPQILTIQDSLFRCMELCPMLAARPVPPPPCLPPAPPRRRSTCASCCAASGRSCCRRMHSPARCCSPRWR
ncbi:hypothetical protein EMIT0111MI5_30059 [Burkholderia sp. IT-111MI5]